MPIRTALRVRLPNRPGELARVARQLANAGVNLEAVAGVASANEGTVEILPDEADRAAQALQGAGIAFDRADVLVLPASERFINTPGSLAQAAEALAQAGINIESIYIVPGGPTGVQAALGSDDPQRAEQILASLVSA
jgi:hypothetical protein